MRLPGALSTSSKEEGEYPAAIWTIGCKQRKSSIPFILRSNETEGALTVRAEVPGFETNDLTINLEPRRLTISGKRETNKEQKKGKSVYREQCSDEILRSVELPSEVDASQTTATLKNGILELHMPKVAKGGPTRVQVKAR